ncbi:hypothetical protein ACLKA6_015857 [Drosophila palustris]
MSDLCEKRLDLHFKQQLSEFESSFKKIACKSDQIIINYWMHIYKAAPKEQKLSRNCLTLLMYGHLNEFGYLQYPFTDMRNCGKDLNKVLDAYKGLPYLRRVNFAHKGILFVLRGMFITTPDYIICMLNAKQSWHYYRRTLIRNYTSLQWLHMLLKRKLLNNQMRLLLHHLGINYIQCVQKVCSDVGTYQLKRRQLKWMLDGMECKYLHMTKASDEQELSLLEQEEEKEKLRQSVMNDSPKKQWQWRHINDSLTLSQLTSAVGQDEGYKYD